MNFRLARSSRILSALVIGAALVGSAFFFGHNSFDENARVAALVVARGDVRTIQPALDADGDGLPDWEETLRGTDPEKYTVLTDTASTTPLADDPYVPPTTVTARFAEHFLEDIVRNSAGIELDEEGKAKIIDDSIRSLAVQTQGTRYTQRDIRSGTDNSLVALHTYGNKIGDALMSNSIRNEHELTVLNRALQENDPEKLKPLGAVVEVYAAMTRDLLSVETPLALASHHVALINAVAMIRTDIAAMQEIFDDPVSALVHVRQYENNVRGLASALEGVRRELEARGVAYTNEETGVFLFSLRP